MLVDWDIYKKVIGLPVEHIATHLYSACSSKIKSALINTAKDTLSLSEA